MSFRHMSFSEWQLFICHWQLQSVCKQFKATKCRITSNVGLARAVLPRQIVWHSRSAGQVQAQHKYVKQFGALSTGGRMLQIEVDFVIPASYFCSTYHKYTNTQISAQLFSLNFIFFFYVVKEEGKWKYHNMWKGTIVYFTDKQDYKTI
jgi:hypothetical protein